MASKSTEDQTLTFYYGNKDWFVTICGLNGTGLIPGQTLTEAHVTKQECVDMFGDKKSNNGYKTSQNPKFIDRVIWLWKRVHQVDKPVNNDVGFHFCQGLLHEHRHGLRTVDWAELAVSTVNWYRSTKGVKKVHQDWAYAYPSITIDVFTRQPVCTLHPRITAEKLLTTPSTDEVKRRKTGNRDLQSNSTKDIKPSNVNASRVKVEYVKKHVSKAPMEIHTEEIPTVENSNVNIPTLETSIPPVEILIPEKTPHSQKEMAPKASGGSNEMSCECTPSFLNALQHFRIDIERAIDMRIKNLEEEKLKLKSVMDDTRHDVDVATATVKNLMEELLTAKSTLSKADTVDNRGEVRCIQSAIKSSETKLHSKRAKYNAVSLEWRHQVQLLTEKCQAQKLLETHFRLQDEVDKLLDIARN